MNLQRTLVRTAAAMAATGFLAAMLPQASHAAFTPDQIDKGRYLAIAGNCQACHTAPGGKTFAGGLPMESPIGTVYSTNITPDVETGIGAYTYDEFAAAVRDGVTRDGTQLYPAMPYPAYTKVTDEDMRALYAYFMKGVAPVSSPNRDTDIPWPLSIRWPLALWNSVYVDFGTFQSRSDRDARWNRGAYLVEGLGHCGTCHTPRGLGYQELSTSDAEGASFLSGANIDGWHAKDLRGGTASGLGRWTSEDLHRFLKTGRNGQTAAFGGMVEVITHSTQHLTDADLSAMVSYIKSLRATPGTDLVRSGSPDQTYALLKAGDYSRPGATEYVEYCASCHRLGGTGVSRVYPALAGNSAVLSDDPSSLIRITLDGGHMAATALEPFAVGMPAFDRLEDAAIAGILSFVRSSWGNAAPQVDAAEVADMREVAQAARERAGLSAPSNGPVTADGMMPFSPPADSLVPEGEQGDLIRYGRRLLGDTKHLLPDYVGADMNCTSCHMNGGKTALGGAFYGSAPLFPQFNPRAGRDVTLTERINGCMMRSMNGRPLPPQSTEMQAMLAYFEWLSAGIPKGAKVAGRGIGNRNMQHVPDPVNGARVYQEKCALCHGEDGQGMADASGDIVFPPLWGERSFNIGAGMARTYTAAAFVLNNMPIAWGTHWPVGQGKALTEQEAVDVSEYFTHMPRPDFAGKVNDWAGGKKPRDARY